MSKDTIRDISLLASHPIRITQYIEDIIKVIEDLRAEGYEMYNMVLEKKMECQQKAEEANNRIQEEKNYNPQSYANHTEDLHKQKKKYENKYNSLNQSQRSMENIAQQCVKIQKTAEVLKENVERTNQVFINTLNYFEEAK